MSFSLADPNIWASLLSLTMLEIVLGIDNVIFLSLIISRLPPAQRKLARQIGLGLALLMRVALLMVLSWVIGLTEPVFSVFGQDVSWRDIILIAGGLFLIAKATHEIYQDIEGEPEDPSKSGSASSFVSIILMIIAIDLVFSLDSIITAVGIAKHIEIMIAAVVIAMLVMYLAAGAVSSFIERHHSTKLLALGVLILIGFTLFSEGMHHEIPRGYIYFAMGFAGIVELFNILARRQRRSAYRGPLAGHSGGGTAAVVGAAAARGVTEQAGGSPLAGMTHGATQQQKRAAKPQKSSKRRKR